jgi:cardiolipin synthase
MARSLLVLPDDSPQPILDSIHAAEKSLRIKMFVFSDPAMLQAVVDAKKRGAKVQVMLNPTRRSGQVENEESRKVLIAGGVDVIDSNPAFDLTHEKSMVVDDRTAFVYSLNWDPKNLTQTRDFAVVTDHPHEVEEIKACFDADWARQDFDPGDRAHMVWCKGNARDRIANLIDNTKHTLVLQNERYQDPIIIERLIRARMRGVKIHVMARPPHTLKEDKLVEGVGGLRMMDDVGIKVHKLKHLKLHAKMLLSDQLRAIIGSINLTPGSFDSRRELAIEVSDENVIERLHKTVHDDWQNSHPLDLSDEGLLKDLENRRSTEALALNAAKGNQDKSERK